MMGDHALSRKPLRCLLCVDSSDRSDVDQRMSTKIPLIAGPSHELYVDDYDDGSVFLKFSGVEFAAGRDEVTVRLPLAIWEHIRAHSPARFDLADMSDEELEKHVVAKWLERQERIRSEKDPGFARAIGRAVWCGNTPEAELEAGHAWHRDERARQRRLRDEIASLVSGGQPDRRATDVINQLQTLPPCEVAKVRDWLIELEEESPAFLAAIDKGLRSADANGVRDVSRDSLEAKVRQGET